MNPRGAWSPVLLAEYRLAPWQLERFTARELDTLFRFHNQRVREAESDGE